jgi:hypothetical protein
MGGVRNICRISVGKCEGNRPLRRPRHREVKIKIDLKEIGYKRCELGTSGSGYGPVAEPCEYGNGYLGSINGAKSFAG